MKEWKKNTHFKLEHSNSDWNWKKTCNRTFCSSKLNFLWNERHQEFQSQSAMSTRFCWKLDFHLMKSCECVCVCVCIRVFQYLISALIPNSCWSQYTFRFSFFFFFRNHLFSFVFEMVSAISKHRIWMEPRKRKMKRKGKKEVEQNY